MLKTGEILTLLSARGYVHNRALGQHFLSDEAIIEGILDAAAPQERDVLEIGAGPGIMTAPLCARARRVLAVELDRQVVPILEEATRGARNLTIERADIMKADLQSLTGAAFGGEFDIVSNLPYSITTPILNLLLKSQLPIRRMTLMMQKEAAERLFAKPGTKEYGPLALLAEYRAAGSVIMDVPPCAFTPPPHVVSTVIGLQTRPAPADIPDEKLFLRLISAAFATRRKTLANNLSTAFSIPRADCEALITRTGLDSRIRGEALSFLQFAALSSHMADYFA